MIAQRIASNLGENSINRSRLRFVNQLTSEGISELINENWMIIVINKYKDTIYRRAISLYEVMVGLNIPRGLLDVTINETDLGGT